MLALIASLQKPGAKVQPAAAKGIAQAFDALGGNGGHGRGKDAAQLAALQGAP